LDVIIMAKAVINCAGNYSDEVSILKTFSSPLLLSKIS
jgi:hypothetical protein